MISKKQIQYINSLKTNKFRKVHQKFITEGPKLLEELLNSSFEIDTIYATEQWIEKNSGNISGLIEVIKISAKELDRISALKSPNQVLSVVNMQVNKSIPASIFSDLILVLDEIKDPGNMGTIIRTVDWFGIKNIVCSDDSVDIYNPKVVQATMGSITRVNVYYTILKDFFQNIHDSTKVYGAFPDGENLYNIEPDNKGIILIGNESRGISDSLYRFVTDRITIPAFGGKNELKAESLNASVATAILCSEFRRRFQ